MHKRVILIIHGFALVGVIVAAIGLSSWRGELWPLDLRFSALVTAGGLVILLFGWGPVWLVPLLLSFALKRHWQRFALWPFAVLAMIALHATFGPQRGFMALGHLTMTGALSLYAVPVALSMLFGSVLREAFRRQTTSKPTIGDGQIPATRTA